jgi:L-lactate dehydrogenase complex protein LldE
MIVDLFVPCFIDQIAPQTAWNTIEILEKYGCKVNYNVEQTCCGNPAFDLGHVDESKEIAEKFLSDFNNNRYIVVPSSSCVQFVKKKYMDMFNNSSLHNECKLTQNNIIELSQFLNQILKINKFDDLKNENIFYLDCCIDDKNKNVLRQMITNSGVEIVNKNCYDSCCGFAGFFSVKYEPISVSLTEQLVNTALNLNATTIVTSDANCVININAYLKNANKNITAKHFVDYVLQKN